MIKDLLFDFGDIFINLDKLATLTSINAKTKVFVDDKMLEINYQYERGEISTDSFIQFYRDRLPDFNEQELIQAWNAIILDFPEERLKWLEYLKEEGRYRLFLISNTNELHMTEVLKKMGKKRFHRFQNCFEGFYLSHEIGMRKPERQVFLWLMQKHDMKAAETLFIDDTEENTTAAAHLGMKVWNLNPRIESVIELNRYLAD